MKFRVYLAVAAVLVAASQAQKPWTCSSCSGGGNRMLEKSQICSNCTEKLPTEADINRYLDTARLALGRGMAENLKHLGSQSKFYKDTAAFREANMEGHIYEEAMRLMERDGFTMREEPSAVSEVSKRHHGGSDRPDYYPAGFWHGPAPFCRTPWARCSPNPTTVSCISSPYRTLDGTCNSLSDQTRGATMIPLRRSLNPDYADGVSAARGQQSPSVSSLPNPRQLSLAITTDIKPQSNFLSLMMMQVGQFISHDMGLTPLTEKECCGADAADPGCLPISVSDARYAGVTNCLTFTRSSVCGGGGSTREQINGITSYLDLSQLYGSDENTNRKLRSLQNGRMKVEDNFLPTNTLEDIMGQFMAGDIRVNEQPALTAMHYLWVLEHNRVAGIIEGLRSSWSDEKIFQTARKIVTAEWQMVVYGEFLPILFGTREVDNLGINERPSTYDSSLDASVSNVWTTAAFRFGHTLVQNEYLAGGANIRIRDGFFTRANPAPAKQHFNQLILGLTTQAANPIDRCVASDLTDELLRGAIDHNNPTLGADLPAFNIQRGRDHGIPSYGAWRCACGIENPPTGVKPHEISSENWQVVTQAYGTSDVNAMDLWPLMLSEEPVPGGLVGPTLGCLLSEQFRRTKHGDRFFFTHYRGQNHRGFNHNQREIIYGRNMAQILCDNVAGVTHMQHTALLLPSSSNRVRSCQRNLGAQEINYFL